MSYTETMEHLASLWPTREAGVPVRFTPPIEMPDTDRHSLADLFASLGYRTGAEIGVEQGVYSRVLCEANPHVRLLCIDPWRTYKGYRDHVSQDKLDGFYEATVQRLSPWPATILRMTSLEAADNVPPESLDFVYLDGNHSFGHVAQDLQAWVPKVRSGGIVAGHDYRQFTGKMRDCTHVVEAVSAFVAAYRIDPWFVCGRTRPVPGERHDMSRSWFWVKA